MNAAPLVRLLARRPVAYLRLTALWILLRTSVLATGLLLRGVFDALAVPVAALVPAVLLTAILATETVRIFLWYGVILSRLEPGYTYGVRSRVRYDVLDSVLRRPAARALDKPAGDVVSRLGTDADEVGIFAIWSASNVARVVIAAAAIVIMLTIDPVVTTGVIVPVVLVVLAGRALNGPIGRYRTASRAAAGEVSTLVGEAVTGFQAIKVARAERRLLTLVGRAGDKRRAAAVREETLVALQSFLFNSTAVVGTGMVLFIAANRLRAGTFTVGDLALFAFYIHFVTEAVNALGMFFGRYKRAALSLDRLRELSGPDAAAGDVDYLDREPPPPPPVTSGATGADRLESLTVTGLSYRHPGSGRGVWEVDLTLRAGTMTVVTGPVGAGKSTLLKALLGLLPADRGVVEWNGVPVPDVAEVLLPPRVGYVPQVPRLFSGTLEWNVLLHEDRDDERVLAALRAAAFDVDLPTLADGLDTVVGPRGLRLSGGQIQRVAAARMIVRGSELMVVDDLSNALDADTECQLWDNIAGLDHTVLAVSHRPSVLARADLVVELTDGRVTFAGSAAEYHARRPGRDDRTLVES